jgi:hypothetical protein
MPITLLIAVLVLVAVLTIGLLLKSLMRRSDEPLPDEAWLRSFSAARYRPMLRLLAEDDYEFLMAASNDKAAVRRLRTERRQIFRMYLNNLTRDFSRLHLAARILVLESEEERSGVAERLMRIRFDFFVAVFAVRCRLALHALGIGTVDVRGLVEALEQMGGDLRTLVPATQSAAS